MRKYELFELTFQGPEPTGSMASVDLEAEFVQNGVSTAVKGFYAGNGIYKVCLLYTSAGGTVQLCQVYPAQGFCGGSPDVQQVCNGGAWSVVSFEWEVYALL